MSRTWAKGSTRAWSRLRALVLLRDGYACQLETDRCVKVADCVHHTAGRSVTGDDPRYLMASCTPCNLKLGDPSRAPDPPGRSVTRW